MLPFELLLSESQERMLVVVKKGKEETIEKIFKKWDINCAIIGEVNTSKKIQYYMYDELVAEVNPDHLCLGGGAPIYEREYTEPKYREKIKAYHIDQIEEPKDLKEVALHLINHPNLTSKKWVYEQYDSMVGTANMVTNAPSDAALTFVKGTNKAIAMTTDCNSRYVFADPERGAAIAVAEAARNIVCSGGEPLAITNCLNFGNPYNPEVFWQFVGTIKGMGEACRKFETPVTGGNVSFYNQSSDEGPVFPTPTIGMVGLLDDLNDHMTLNFKNEGDLIYLLGEPKNDIGCSQYLVSYHNVKYSSCPEFDIEEEYKLQQVTKELIKNKLINSAHDVADGGLFIALLESAMPNDVGFEIKTDENFRKDAFLFGESQSRIVVSVSPDKKELIETLLNEQGQSYIQLGTTVGVDVVIEEESYGSIHQLKNCYDNALKNMVEG